MPNPKLNPEVSKPFYHQASASFTPFYKISNIFLPYLWHTKLKLAYDLKN
jgi:hypothetical protein